ncbi:MAG: radical SAM protein [Pseudomonadota bacterium]
MPQPAANPSPVEQSPDQVRLSLAAAMTLGLAQGRFYRDARLGCINLLLTYPGGCRANCAFCGLARANRPQQGDPRYEKFIRVSWKSYALDEILERCTSAPAWVERVCVSMITHPQARQDTLDVCRRTRAATSLPVSLLIAPTLLAQDDLARMLEAGADRVGVAIDAATPELFEKLRGRPVGGPHRWEHYWRTFEQALEAFGQGMVGVHLIHGLGESEQDLVLAMDRAKGLGGCTHLFCFFPERFSALAEAPQPQASGYRRVQMARWLIDQGLTRASAMAFDQQGRVADFGVEPLVLEQALASGQPFMTSGCPGASGRVACNRPYGNEKPGPDLRNYPFDLEPADLDLVRAQMAQY